MFEIYTFLILGVTVIAAARGWLWHRDTLHPLLFLMPFSAYMYCFTPLVSDTDVLSSYFTLQELEFVQGLNLAGVVALAAGCIAGSRGLKRDASRTDFYSFFLNSLERHRLRVMGIVFGVIALSLYTYGLTNVGGFIEAYNSAKGGGYASSGYLRDLTLLVIPAALFTFLGTRRPMSLRYQLMLVLYSIPLLFHGLLSARRGPTFMALATLGIGWYLSQNRRPSLLAVAGSGISIGILLAVLVAFRGQIYFGSNLLSEEDSSIGTIVTESIDKQLETSTGNEFVYGSLAALEAKRERDHFWGKRYLTYVFVRPIPRSLWPTKYRDVGMESLLVNAGTLGSSEVPDPYGPDEAPKGAAPGFVSDLFVEFRWGMVPASFGFGWLFGFLWYRSTVYGGIWMILHSFALILSLYFISQTVEAILSRFLVLTVPTALVWRLSASRLVPQAKAYSEVLGS